MNAELAANIHDVFLNAIRPIPIYIYRVMSLYRYEYDN